MSFGETLKKIRTKNGDSLRRLGEKTDIYFTRIDKIEKGTNYINKEMLGKLLEVYSNPYDQKKLISSYIEDLLPENIEKFQKNSNENIEEIYFKFLKDLKLEERKNIYNFILEKIELISLKDGTYEEKKNEIEIAKNIINNLK